MRFVGRVVVFGVFIALTYPYALAPLCSVDPARTFQGTQWHNPYATLSNNWYKANVHLHSRAWWGTTDGRLNTHASIDSVYRLLGYDLLSLSNYQQIDTLPQGWLHLPCYEHGYNVSKTHQLALGAHEVVWVDCILPQTRAVKQWLLDILRPTTEALILAHPAFGRPSYDTNDLALLSNYDCIEVFNHYRNSLAHWDSALSAGILAWAIGNDDCHNVFSAGETGVCLTLVNVPESPKAQDIYTAYRTGKVIAVRTRNAELPLGIPIQRLEGDSIIIVFTGIADSVRFIGDSGRILRRVNTPYSQVAIELPERISYVRAEIYAKSTVYALNPIVRTQSEQPAQLRRLQTDFYRTLLNRALWLALYIAVGSILLRRHNVK